MASQVIDSILFKDLFGSERMRQVFSDENLAQKWLDVEAALARAEAQVGLIPRWAAEEISRKARIENIDLNEIKRGTEVAGYPILPLVRALERICNGDAGQYVHWGATTQDIMDTANVLQLKEAYQIIFDDLRVLEEIMVDLAERHKHTIMAGRTHGQHALPITFGFKVAVWISEIRRHIERLKQCRKRLFVGQFAGAVGTLASVKEHGLKIQRLMMEDLGLEAPCIAWHTARDGFAEFVCILGMLASTLGKIANEIALLQKTEIAEVEEPFVKGKGSSSTMPQKRNPVTCEMIIAISKIVKQNVPVALDSMVQDHERGTGPWQVEWKFLPETCILVGGSLKQAIELMRDLVVKPENMRKNLNIQRGLILAESIMMQLAPKMGRQNAYDLVYKACMEAMDQGVTLKEAMMAEPKAAKHLSQIDLEAALDPEAYTGLSSYFVDQVISKTRELRRTD